MAAVGVAGWGRRRSVSSPADQERPSHYHGGHTATPHGAILPKRNPVVDLIVSAARRYGVDPSAALAVAAVEGGHRYGAVGDQGTSYGPFQLHVGGALPRGRGAGWANSPAGIDYAVRQIAGVARGKRGKAAVAAIVRGFERPADPAGEISRALGHYGSGGGLAGSQAVPAGTGPTGNPGLSATRTAPLFNPLLAGVLQSNADLIGAPAPDFSALTKMETVRRPLAQAAPSPASQVTGGRSGAAKHKRGKTIRFLEHYAAPFGLTITSTTTGKHVKGSYHYKGRAVDFGGSPQQMAALAQSALQHPQDFAEMFYDPAGFYIKDGKVYKGAIGGHTDHVHLAR